MSWFDSIKGKSHSKNGNLISIRITQRKDSEGELAYFVGDQWVGGEFEDGAAIIVPCALAEAVFSMVKDDSQVSGIVQDAMIALLISTQPDFFHQLAPMQRDWSTVNAKPITGDFILEIPHAQFQYEVQSKSVHKMEYRNVYFMPLGAYMNKKQGQKNEYHLRADGFGGFHVPDTSIIGVRVHGTQGLGTVGETLCHEYIHASWNVSGVENHMYGATEADRREECLVHYTVTYLDSLVYVRDKLPKLFSHKLSRVKPEDGVGFINTPKDKDQANWGLPLMFVREPIHERDGNIWLSREDSKFNYNECICLDTRSAVDTFADADDFVLHGDSKFTRANCDLNISRSISKQVALQTTGDLSLTARGLFNAFKEEYKQAVEIAKNNSHIKNVDMLKSIKQRARDELLNKFNGNIRKQYYHKFDNKVALRSNKF